MANVAEKERETASVTVTDEKAPPADPKSDAPKEEEEEDGWGAYWVSITTSDMGWTRLVP